MKKAAALCCLTLLVLLACSCGPELGTLDQNDFHQRFTDLMGSMDLNITVNDWNVDSGGRFELSYTLDVDISDLAQKIMRERVKGIWIVLSGERVFDETGRFRQMSNVLMSTQLTTTGLPVESFQPVPASRQIGHLYGSPLEFAEYVSFDQDQKRSQITRSGSWNQNIDSTVPPGLYRLSFEVILDTDRFGAKQWPVLPFLEDNYHPLFLSTRFNPLFFMKFVDSLRPRRILPLVKIGHVETPRLPWVLFPDIDENGNMGVVANEDKDRFALSSRARFPTRLIFQRSTRTFYPVFISNFPLAGKPSHLAGMLNTYDEVPLYLDYESGQVSARVITPDRVAHDLGTRHFAGWRKGGPLLDGGDFSWDFNQDGKHTVILEGEIRDILGRTFTGGGSYDVWIGNWLTYSTTVKPGTNFFTGGVFPTKLEVNPACPADVSMTVDYYPHSDPERKRTYRLTGRANNYGYFFPPKDAAPLVFDEPGEYRSDFFAEYHTPDGSEWFGSQTSAGVIEGSDSRVAVHGMRSSDQGSLFPERKNFGMEARYSLKDEATSSLNFFDMSDCYDVMIPFYSGDVLYMTSGYTGQDTITSLLSLEPRDPMLRSRLARAFSPSRFHSVWPHSDRAVGPVHIFRPDFMVDLTYLIRDDDQADMFPIMSLNRDGTHPYLFPGSNEVETYTYFSALRPGLTPFVLVADSTPLGPYWGIGGNRFRNQINAGPNGDMPTDIYRVAAGLVFKDKTAGTVDYANYAATIVITPKDTNDNRVRGPMEEPLFWMNGRPQWLGLAMATDEVMEVGDRISLGAMVFPPVPAEIENSLIWPDDRVETVTGMADRIGIFGGGVFTVDIPGVYRVRAKGTYKGKTGEVFGSGDGEFFHFVLEKNHPDILHVDLPMRASYDVTRDLEIPLQVVDGFTDAKVTYSVICPGIILDEGELDLKDGHHTFRFMADQFAMQFPSFETVRFADGRPELGDSVFLVFFVTAVGPDGRIAHDVEKVMVRQDSMYYLNPEVWGTGGHPKGSPKHGEAGATSF